MQYAIVFWDFFTVSYSKPALSGDPLHIWIQNGIVPIVRAFIQIGYPGSLGGILTDVSCIVLLGSILCVHCKYLQGITVILKTL